MPRFLTFASLALAALTGLASATAEPDEVTVATATSSGEEVVLIWVNSGGSATTSTASTPTATTGTTHQVTVGGEAGLVYTPDTLTAAVGDMVEFTFMSENHTVTQSSFNTPCIHDTLGLDSGFMENINNTVNPPPRLAFQVQVATPIWMYCRQTGHCGKGMVFSINPTANKTQDDFRNLAIQQNGTAADASSTSSSSNATSSSTSTTSSSGSSSSIATGTAGTDSSGQCSCSCLCGVTDFPSGAGLDAVGGMSGAIAISEVGTLGRRAAMPMIAAS